MNDDVRLNVFVFNVEATAWGFSIEIVCTPWSISIYYYCNRNYENELEHICVRWLFEWMRILMCVHIPYTRSMLPVPIKYAVTANTNACIMIPYDFAMQQRVHFTAKSMQFGILRETTPNTDRSNTKANMRRNAPHNIQTQTLESNEEKKKPKNICNITIVSIRCERVACAIKLRQT